MRVVVGKVDPKDDLSDEKMVYDLVVQLAGR
jgi:hypothetical protein